MYDLYDDLVYPYLQYCNLDWGSAMKTVMQPLVLLQKKVVRSISGAGYWDHTDPLSSELLILKLFDIHRLKLYIKFVNNQQQAPTVITFDLVSSVHNHNLRNQKIRRLPQPRSEATKRFVK